MKKTTICVSVAVVLSLFFIQLAWAGASGDYGAIPGSPPAGTINWTAWLGKHITPGGYPSQVMTEDNTNNEMGADGGYQQLGFPPAPRWLMQVENYLDGIPGDTVNMLFGGLGAQTGHYWGHSFAWTNLESLTLHPDATTLPDGGDCPVDAVESIDDDSYQVNWTGQPGTYHIYRSQNTAFIGSGRSNGLYFYVATQATNGAGQGSYTDNTVDPTWDAWYVVIHAGASGALDGCHSEPGTPTAVELADFSAGQVFNVVELRWETGFWVDLLGFNLYRAASLDGERQLLNAELIPAELGSPGMAAYAFVDAGAPPGVTVYYWLEAVDLDGSQEAFGPQVVSMAHVRFLPISIR